MGWIKNILTSENLSDEHSTGRQKVLPQTAAAKPATAMKEYDDAAKDNNKFLFSKDNQDKTVLDVIVSLENMLKERQLIAYKNKGLEDQLATANETINRFKHDQIKKDQLIQEKNKEIRELENNLTNKQMRYDQLLEDYKEYQQTSNTEYEKLSIQLEKESAKYNKLYEESTKAQYESMAKVNELEEKIRNLEIENQNFAEQYQKIVEDKEELLQTFNDFTEKMSFSFSPKTTVSNK